MSLFDIKEFFVDLAIRDTIDHISSDDDARSYRAETVFWKNTLDENASLQLQGSPYKDFSLVFDVGPTFTAYKDDTGYETVTAKFLFFRIKAKCTTQPTTGALTVGFIKGE